MDQSFSYDVLQISPNNTNDRNLAMKSFACTKYTNSVQMTLRNFNQQYFFIMYACHIIEPIILLNRLDQNGLPQF